MTVEEYYDQVEGPAKTKLLELRAIVLQLLDQPEEIISYQIPTFVSRGKRVCAIAAFKEHVSLFPMSTRQVDKFAEEIGKYRSGRSTLRFDLAQPLPEPLIRKVVQDKLEQLGMV